MNPKKHHIMISLNEYIFESIKQGKIDVMDAICKYATTQDKSILGHLSLLVSKTHQDEVSSKTQQWMAVDTGRKSYDYMGGYYTEEYSKLFKQYISQGKLDTQWDPITSKGSRDEKLCIDILSESGKVFPWKQSIRDVAGELRKMGMRTLADFVEDCPTFEDTFVVYAVVLKLMNNVSDEDLKELLGSIYDVEDYINVPFDPILNMSSYPHVVGTSKWNKSKTWDDNTIKQLAEEIAESNFGRKSGTKLWQSIHKGMGYLMSAILLQHIILTYYKY